MTTITILVIGRVAVMASVAVAIVMHVVEQTITKAMTFITEVTEMTKVHVISINLYLVGVRIDLYPTS